METPPDPVSPAAERGAVIHSLSEKVQIVALALPTFRDVIARLDKLELGEAAAKDLERLGGAVSDVHRACKDSIALFERLRKVV